MNNEQLQIFLDSHGADPAGWPAAQRAAVEYLIARKAEADLRCNLVRAREFAESIAMFDGGDREYERSSGMLHALVVNNAHIIWTMFGYEAFQNATQYLTGLAISLIMLAKPTLYCGRPNP